MQMGPKQGVGGKHAVVSQLTDVSSKSAALAAQRQAYCCSLLDAPHASLQLTSYYLATHQIDCIRAMSYVTASMGPLCTCSTDEDDKRQQGPQQS